MVFYSLNKKESKAKVWHALYTYKYVSEVTNTTNGIIVLKELVRVTLCNK